MPRWLASARCSSAGADRPARQRNNRQLLWLSRVSIVETARAVLEQELRASRLAPPQLPTPSAPADPTARPRLHAALDVLLDALARLASRGSATAGAACREARLPLLAAGEVARAGAAVE